MSTTTTQSNANAAIVATFHVWGKTIEAAMRLAQKQQEEGWIIQGSPAPMMLNGVHGTGVSISRIVYEDQDDIYI